MLKINTKVREIEGCKASDIPESVLKSTSPVVLKGLVSHWPLVDAGRCSTEQAVKYILEFYSGRPVSALLGDPADNGRLFYNKQLDGFNFQSIRGKLDQVLAELFSRIDKSDAVAGRQTVPTCYVGSTNVDHWFPGLRQKNDLALSSYNPMVSIWLGNQSRVAAHYDFPNNIACSVIGHRRFTLFPPNQLENLYVGPLDFTPAGQAISMVDFSNPDYDKHPKFREALQAAQVAELEPGDALFLPSMWWHHVESLDQFNVLINYWWRTSSDFLGSPVDALLHAILSFRDLPAEQRVVWKELLDYYVFDAKEEKVSHIPKQRRGVLAPIDEDLAKNLRMQLIDSLKNQF